MGPYGPPWALPGLHKLALLFVGFLLNSGGLPVLLPDIVLFWILQILVSEGEVKSENIALDLSLSHVRSLCTPRAF